jgi:hypothetical protein
MSALSRRVAQIEARFGAEAAAAWRKYHIAAQLGRLASGVLGSVMLAALHGGVHDWTGLVPVATGALWATLAEIWPQVPWLLLISKFHLGGQPASPTPGGVGG